MFQSSSPGFSLSHDHYDNPLISRYASPEMSRLWGGRRKFSTWRKLWVWLAEAEAELGLGISTAQLDALRRHVDDVDLEAAARHERRLRHDVMAHVHAYGDVCPEARGIIHLGATSCYVTDNTDLLLMREGLGLVAGRLAAVIDRLATFAVRWRDTACLGFTHFQPAQPTTVGKRACLWAYDLAIDLEEIERRITTLKARGAKGTTGSQASFLELFHGDHAKVQKLDELVAHKMGFDATYAVTGQTYSRKIDLQIIAALTGVAVSAHKAATDLRLLAGRKEIEEPFEEEQIGSSAMAYKRNPMRAERICGLARFVMSLESSPATTAATQWLERTLDDSANRRLVLPQAFLATDALLLLYQNVASGLVVYPRVIARHLGEELPFMATENILMAAVEAGGDRQDLHERIRRHSQAAAAEVKDRGGSNDLLHRLAGDPAFSKINLQNTLDPAAFVGRAPEQVDEFVADIVEPIRQRYLNALKQSAEVRV
jgi:adenylosuccinate lyase